MAVLFEGGLALLLGGGPVVGDVRHVALLLVAVVALDGPVVHCLLNLQGEAEKSIDERSEMAQKSVTQQHPFLLISTQCESCMIRPFVSFSIARDF